MAWGELKYIPQCEVQYSTWYVWNIEGILCAGKHFCQRSCTIRTSDLRKAKIKTMLMCVLVSTFKHFESNTICKQIQPPIQIPNGGILPVLIVSQLIIAVALVLKLNIYLPGFPSY